MARTSFAYRIDVINPVHTSVTIFAGPDEQHRAKVGNLTFRTDEWHDFRERVEGPGHTIHNESFPRNGADIVETWRGVTTANGPEW